MSGQGMFLSNNNIHDSSSDISTRSSSIISNTHPTSPIRRAFSPLGVFAKVFGLFPRYDFSFVERFEGKKGIRIIHILDYLYSFLILSFMGGGALLCTIQPPNLIKRIKIEKKGEVMDFYINLAVIYATMAMGVMSLLFFPSKGPRILRLLEHFAKLDEVLEFKEHTREFWFAVRILMHMAFIFLGSLLAFGGLYVLEVRMDEQNSVTDYLMSPVMAAGVALLVPTGLVVFFLNALNLRLCNLSQIMETVLEKVTPSYYACTGYYDYGKELESQMENVQFAQDLEKLRIFYIELGSLAKEVGCIFGPHLASDVLYSITGLILYTYYLIFMGHSTITNWFIYVILDLFLVFKLLTMANFAQGISCYGASSIQKLRKVSLLKLSSSSQLQIQMFIDALESPIKINAAGFFTIDRRLITSILGAITTYFIILIQFKVGDVKSELNKALTKVCNVSVGSPSAIRSIS